MYTHTSTTVAIKLQKINAILYIMQLKKRGHPDLNQGPLDLQSNALPLSYTPHLHFTTLP